MTTQPPPESAEPTPAHVEALAAKVHESWMATKIAAHATSRKSETGEELMVPYDQLSEHAKELDRVTVRAVLAAQAALAEPAPVATDTQARLHVTTNENIMADDFARAFSCCGGNDETPQGHCADCPEHPSCPGCGNEVCECVATPAPAGDAEVSHEQAREAVEFNGTITESRAVLRRYIDQQEARQQQAERLAELSRAEWEQGGYELAEYISKHPEAVVGRGVRGEAVRVLKLADARQQQAEREVAELKRQLTDSEEEVARYLNTERVGLKAEVAELKSRLLELGPDLDEANGHVKAGDEQIERLEAQCAELSRKLEAAELALKDFESPTCSGEWLSGSGGHRVFGGCGKPAVWVEHGTGAAFCDEHGPTFQSPTEQAPPAKPLTRDDVKVIARAVIAEVAERAAERTGFGAHTLHVVAEAAKEET